MYNIHTDTLTGITRDLIVSFQNLVMNHVLQYKLTRL